MLSFSELKDASIEAYEAGDKERAFKIRDDALEAKKFEELKAQAIAAYEAGDKELAFDLRDQSLAIEKGMTESAFTGIGRGIKAAPVTIAQGLLESGAAAYDAAMDTNYASSVSDSFEEFKKENDLNPYTAAGQITEEIVSFGLGFIPIAGWLGRANSVAKAAKAGRTIAKPKSGFFKSADSFGRSSTGKALLGSRAKLAGATALGTVGYETLVTPSNRATLSDTYDVLPDFLRKRNHEPSF